MGLHLKLNRTVSIENDRLALIYYLLQLAIVGYCIYAWFENRGGTLELTVSAHLVVWTFTEDSLKAATQIQPHRDPRCLGIQTSNTATCADLMFEECPLARKNVDNCTDFFDSLLINSPFDVQIRAMDHITTYADPNITSPNTTFTEIARYNSFIEAYVFELNYSFVVNVPATSLNSDLIRTGTNDNAKTVLLDAHGMPAQIYAPGAPIHVRLPRLLQLMQNPLDKIYTKTNSLGSFPGDDTKFPDWLWFSGCTLFLSVTCYSDDFDIKGVVAKAATSSNQHSTDTVWDMGASKRMPVCFVSVQLADASSMSILVMERQPGLTKRKSYLNIHVISKSGVGLFRAFDLQACVMFLTSSLVLVALPKKFVRFVTLNCLGQLSRIYQSVVAQTFDVQYFCAKSVMQLVSQSVNFVELADQTGLDGVLYGGISWRRMLERVSAVLRHRRTTLDDNEVQVLAEFAFSRAMRGVQDKKGGILDFFDLFDCRLKFGDMITQGKSDLREATLDIDNFCQVTGSEEISINSIAKLFDKDRKPCIFERIFLPPTLWTLIHESQVDSKSQAEKETTEEPEEKQQEPSIALGRGDLDDLPLERRKKSAHDESGRITGLRQEVILVTQELANMRKHINGLQTALLRESEKRSAAEAALRDELARDMQETRDELASGMQEMQATVSGIETHEAERQRDVLAVLDLCKEVEREVIDHGARLQSEITSIRNYSSQEVSMPGSEPAARETTTATTTANDGDGLDKPKKRAHRSAKCPLRTAHELHHAVKTLASSHSHLLQVVTEQSSRIESLERRTSAEPRQAHSAIEDHSGRGGGRWNDFMRRFQREAKDMTHEKSAVVQCVVADPVPSAAAVAQNSASDPSLPAAAAARTLADLPPPTATVMQHAMADPSLPASASNDVVHHAVKPELIMALEI